MGVVVTIGVDGSEKVVGPRGRRTGLIVATRRRTPLTSIHRDTPRGSRGRNRRATYGIRRHDRVGDRPHPS